MNRGFKKGKQHLLLNFALLTFALVALGVYLTVKSKWNGGTAAAVMIIGAVDGFYLWLLINWDKK